MVHIPTDASLSRDINLVATASDRTVTEPLTITVA
jgi:hypothetical protein